MVMMMMAASPSWEDLSVALVNGQRETIALKLIATFIGAI